MKITEDRLPWIASKSIVNCHAAGVDSILFDDTPGKRVRAFIATEKHELWKNSPANDWKFSVALHPHHCAVSLAAVFGCISNIVADVVPHDHPSGEMFEVWVYQTRIAYKGEEPKRAGMFASTGYTRMLRLRRSPLTELVRMPAHRIHTIHVPKGERAAWFVYEGEEDPGYQPFCYSNVELHRQDFSHLYQPMTVDYLRGKLEQLGIERLNLVEV